MACLIFVLLFVIATVVHAAVPSAEQYKIEGLEKFGATGLSAILYPVRFAIQLIITTKRF